MKFSLSMKFIFSLILLALNFPSFSQIGTGEWRFHSSTSEAIDVVATENYVFTAYKNGLSVLDLSDKSHSLYNALNKLSDIEITCLYFDPSDDALYIGYGNGNIDKLKNDLVYNIPALKLAQISNSKRVNRFEKNGAYIYVACDFAILKLDPTKNEIKDTYYPTNSLEGVSDLCFKNDTLFALTPTKLLYGIISNPALADQSQWNVDSRLALLSGGAYQDIEIFNSQLVVLLKTAGSSADTVYKVLSTGNQVISNFSWSAKINSIKTLDETNFIINAQGGYSLHDENLNQISLYGTVTFNQEFLVSNSSKNSSGIWVADKKLGLVWFPSAYFSFDRFPIEGTRNTFLYSIDSQKGKNAIASGYLNGKFPAYSKNGIHFFENENWSFTDIYEQPCWQGQNIWDILDVSINPLNLDEYAVCTPSEVPVTIFTNSTGKVYSDTNSTLKTSSSGSGLYLVSDVCYDEKGNLWCLNGYSDRPLNVKTSDGIWYNFDLGTNAKNKYTKKMIVDFDGTIWSATDNAGLFGYTTNSTISSTSDDKKIQLKSGENYGNLPSDNVTAIAADFEGEIWIGTDAGFAILYNANSSFDANPGEYDAQRVKVQYEGNVEYVLGSTHITDIEVDGGNRKWIATANAGILLLSADGSEIIEQHTTENSPLISDIVYDIKLDQTTGELFIITDKGMVSYRTDATYEDPEYTNTKVFPNPVRPGFLGPITIQGIRFDSDVKVTDVAGNLIYKTTSNGGTATWDGNNLEGKPVASGVYFIWTAQNEEKGKKVGKVLVVR
jgi:hypothetical protein